MTPDIKINYSSYKNELSLKNKIGRLLWNIFGNIIFKILFLKKFNNFRIALLRFYGATIGSNCYVDSTVKIWAPWNLSMECNSLLAEYVVCYNPGKIILKNQTVVSQYTYLCAASHNVKSSKHELLTKTIIIESQAWVGADAFIFMGVTIGEGAVVGARAAVFKDVEAWSIVGGNPAKFIKKRVING